MTAADELDAAFGARLTPSPRPAADARPQVACLGTSTPAEVIRAAGFSVRWVVARPGQPTPDADAYLESGYGPEMRSVLQQVLAGEVDDAALLVLDRSFKDVFYYLKELVRLGLAPGLPPLHMVDLLLAQDLDVAEHNRGQVERLVAALHRVGGVACTADRLAEQVRVTNARVRALQSLQEHRQRGAIDGAAAFRAMAAGAALEPQRHAELLGELVAALADEPGRSQRRVLVWTGEALFHDDLHQAVASLGAQVVDEGDAWSASSQRLVDEGADPVEAVVAHAHRASVGPELRPFEARAARFTAALEATAPDVVLFYVPPNDSVFGWDYPPLREAVLASGATPVLVRQDVLADGGRAAVTAALRAGLQPAGLSGRYLQEGGAA